MNVTALRRGYQRRAAFLSANVAIYVDRTFNLVDYLQSQDRIHRISHLRASATMLFRHSGETATVRLLVANPAAAREGLTLTEAIVLLLANDTINSLIDLEQKHRLAQFAQSDVDVVSASVLALSKPDVQRALLSPDD